MIGEFHRKHLIASNKLDEEKDKLVSPVIVNNGQVLPELLPYNPSFKNMPRLGSADLTSRLEAVFSCKLDGCVYN